MSSKSRLSSRVLMWMVVLSYYHHPWALIRIPLSEFENINVSEDVFIQLHKCLCQNSAYQCWTTLMYKLTGNLLYLAISDVSLAQNHYTENQWATGHFRPFGCILQRQFYPRYQPFTVDCTQQRRSVDFLNTCERIGVCQFFYIGNEKTCEFNCVAIQGISMNDFNVILYHSSNGQCNTRTAQGILETTHSTSDPGSPIVLIETEGSTVWTLSQSTKATQEGVTQETIKISEPSAANMENTETMTDLEKLGKSFKPTMTKSSTETSGAQNTLPTLVAMETKNTQRNDTDSVNLSIDTLLTSDNNATYSAEESTTPNFKNVVASTSASVTSIMLIVTLCLLSILLMVLIMNFCFRKTGKLQEKATQYDIVDVVQTQQVSTEQEEGVETATLQITDETNSGSGPTLQPLKNANATPTLESSRTTSFLETSGNETTTFTPNDSLTFTKKSEINPQANLRDPLHDAHEFGATNLKTLSLGSNVSYFRFDEETAPTPDYTTQCHVVTTAELKKN